MTPFESADQIPVLERMLREHLTNCRFCQKGEACDQRGGYECAIAMHRQIIAQAEAVKTYRL